MRRARQEFLSVSSALALPLAIAVSFPYGAFRFKAADPVPRTGSFAAFVELSAEEEMRATQAVKASWQGDSGGIKLVSADLSVGELPEEACGPVLELSMDALKTPKTEIPVDVPPLPPSMAAPKPQKIPAPEASSGAAAPGAFSREELLKID